MTLLEPDDVEKLLRSCDAKRTLTIRTNTLKLKRRDLVSHLLNAKISVQPITAWSKVSLLLNDITEEQLTNSDDYTKGNFIEQPTASLLPVIALCPQPENSILDMAAAPGGKATYIAQLMNNTGSLIANDINSERAQALEENIKRMGITNTTVKVMDGCEIPDTMHTFDRVLLDAPCSTIGIITQSKKTNINNATIEDYSEKQKKLILSAIDSVTVGKSKGGYIVYAVSSVLPEECECVVQYAINHRHVKLIEAGLPIGSEGVAKYKDKKFSKDIRLCKRIYPHVDNMDGYFIAKLKKVANGVKEVTNGGEDTAPVSIKKQKKLQKKKLLKLMRKQQKQE